MSNEWSPVADKVEISSIRKESTTFSLSYSIMTFPELAAFAGRLITDYSLLIASVSSCLRIVESPFPARLYQDRDLAHFTFVIVFANGGNHITVREMVGGKGFF